MNAAGERMGLIFVFTDLSDIKSLREQVELKQRLSQLGEMSAGISHELRNSMSVITGYAKLLGKRVDEQNQATVRAIEQEIRDMDSIISELLAFARPSVLSTEEVDLNRLVRDTAESVLSLFPSVHLSLSLQDACTVQADAVLMKQALANLFTNAAEAMPDGGSITLHAGEHHGRVEIGISDNGQGISEDVKEKIFLPFFTTKEEGTGFGLALVQKIILSHGGTISVESSEGAGTSFLITLPAGKVIQPVSAGQRG
jgi:signal transduction histidine kinase